MNLPGCRSDGDRLQIAAVEAARYRRSSSRSRPAKPRQRGLHDDHAAQLLRHGPEGRLAPDGGLSATAPARARMIERRAEIYAEDQIEKTPPRGAGPCRRTRFPAPSTESPRSPRSRRARGDGIANRSGPDGARRSTSRDECSSSASSWQGDGRRRSTVQPLDRGDDESGPDARRMGTGSSAMSIRLAAAGLPWGEEGRKNWLQPESRSVSSSRRPQAFSGGEAIRFAEDDLRAPEGPRSVWRPRRR